ncbi:MAG: UDP-N-acetylmuramyl-tripeptide synthetase [Clostridia bacterium]|nr:UDP-N-acetylmuramyl-tripeptide synthetase [Clostridia bacterium]
MIKTNELKNELILNLDTVKDILIKNDLLIAYNIIDKNISYISYDSREIKNNTLFFCKGLYFKEEYLNIAIQKGATAYISEKKYEDKNTSYFIVTNILKAIAIISHEFYKYPDKKIEKIGVTGTKGKTTVTYFLNNILQEHLNSKPGLICSLWTYTGFKDKQSQITTPEALEIQRYFYEMANSKIKNAILEVSSQSYKRLRLEGVEFEYGIFLNIDKDHISELEHPNFEDYFNCKLQFLKHCKNILINRNAEHLDQIIKAVKGKKIVFFGTDNKADYYIDKIIKENKGFSFIVKNDKLKYLKKFNIEIQGRFNVENALAAITMSKMLNIDDKTIQKGLSKTKVPGRMKVYEKSGITVVIDYAHNRLSFEKLFESLKTDYPNRRIISVGGTVGGKAYNRREDFGKIVGQASDYIYLTADDPQFEEPEDICKDIGKYIEDKSKFEIIKDRKTAINKALKNSRRGDVIVLLSKGTDTHQRIKNKEVPYESDVTIIEKKFKIVKNPMNI